MPYVSAALRAERRQADAAAKRALREPEGYRCRFCGILLVRDGTRSVIRQALGQILEYAFHTARQHAKSVRLIIVGRRKIAKPEAGYLDRLFNSTGVEEKLDEERYGC